MGQTFQNILAWQKAYDFVLDVYKYTKLFPDSEKYGLISQFQRAAVSIIANIAEGYKKMGKADKLRFMNISQGSLEECRCYVILSRDLGYIDNEVYNILYSKIEEASKLLNGYCKAMLNSTFSNTLE
jgi:23S ribosomal protein